MCVSKQPSLRAEDHKQTGGSTPCRRGKDGSAYTTTAATQRRLKHKQQQQKQDPTSPLLRRHRSGGNSELAESKITLSHTLDSNKRGFSGLDQTSGNQHLTRGGQAVAIQHGGFHQFPVLFRERLLIKADGAASAAPAELILCVRVSAA